VGVHTSGSVVRTRGLPDSHVRSSEWLERLLGDEADSLATTTPFRHGS
jgi:hypothetical protein